MFTLHPLASLLLSAAAHSDAPAPAPARAPGLRFEVSFSEAAHAGPLTGRAYVAISRDGARPPIRQAGPTGAPLFAKDVVALAPGAPVLFDASVFGHPVESLAGIPAGEYFVQPFFNVYTECKRADGHTVWVHLDRWEGQDWRRSPGNLFGEPVRMSLDPSSDEPVRLLCDRAIPPIEPPADTAQVKRFRMRSEMLSRWWGVPIDLGATVLLPKGYDEHPDARYPVIYQQGHFSTRAPYGFGSGGDFDRLWLAESTPRFLLVTFQHPTPYYDDSYAVNSENNGPYGDALLQELLPEVERRFRAIGAPWARLLTGGSTGGWEALALQIFHPDAFGGCWASCPDPVDFRAHQIVNIYEDANAYWIDAGWTRVERPNLRRVDGNIVSMMKDENLYELVVGERSRSGGQWDIWEATFSPVGPDGYPLRLWDKRTGVIDRAVAEAWKERFDLRHVLETKWSTLGPALAEKLHVYVGDDDSYYLENAVLLLEEFLRSAKEPEFRGTIEYCRAKGHCWGPTAEQLLPLLLDHLERTMPEGADGKSWRY